MKVHLRFRESAMLLLLFHCSPSPVGKARHAPSRAVESAAAVSLSGGASGVSAGASPGVSHAGSDSAGSVGASDVACDGSADGTGLPRFVRISELPVSSFALGKARRAALLAGAHAQLFDGMRWRELQPSLDKLGLRSAQIFFGRDDQPRLLGSSQTATPEPGFELYLRYRDGEWRSGADELGQLARGRTALYGVLGHDDPEVVCRVGQSCIVKRVSGWTTVPAHSEPRRIELSGGTIWALSGGKVESLSARGFVELAPGGWQRAESVWSPTENETWVVDGNQRLLWQRHESAWSSRPSPVRAPKALWGGSGSDVWIVGDGGAAHFDGERWSCVSNVQGPLEFVGARADQIWLSGGSGVWRGESAHGN